jgi:adenine phosphoribosyltransferase
MALTMQDIANGLTYSAHHDVQFWDFNSITTDNQKWKLLIDTLAEHHKDDEIDMIIGLDARGFLLSGALGFAMSTDHVSARKAGKLPGKTIYEEYGKEYVETDENGNVKERDQLHLQTKYIKPGMRVLILDDVLATGGTAEACCKLVERLGAVVAGVTVVIELPELGGRGEKLSAYPVHSLITIMEAQPLVGVEYCVDLFTRCKMTDTLLLIERLEEVPGIAMPGGRIEKGESAFHAAKRELGEETGAFADGFSYIATLTGITRDPRGPKVSIVLETIVNIGSLTGEVNKTEPFLVTSQAELPPVDAFVFAHGQLVHQTWPTVIEKEAALESAI